MGPQEEPTMNPTRTLIVASSLALASLGSAAAHATTSSTSSAGSDAPALVATAGTSPGSMFARRAPLSTGLLALGSAAESRSTPVEVTGQEDAKLAQREQAAPELRNFRGGRVYLYLGGGATL